MSHQARTPHVRDSGAVLPLVLVLSFVLSTVVVGVATYGTANLRYGQVTERRSDQLAAADAAMSYALNLIRTRAAECIFTTGTVDLPNIDETFNGAKGSVTCNLSGGSLNSAALFAMVLTAENVPDTKYVVQTQGGDIKKLGGPLFMDRVKPAATFDLANDKGLLIDGAHLVHYDGSSPSCVAISRPALDNDVVFEPDAIFGQPLCTPNRWYDYNDLFDEPPITGDFTARSTFNLSGAEVLDGKVKSGDPTPWGTIPRDTTAPADLVNVVGAYEDLASGCRVFRPGRYVRPPSVVASGPGRRPVYFKSGDYIFDFRSPSGPATSFNSWPLASDTTAEFDVNKALITAGRPDPSVNFTPQLTNSACEAAWLADGGPAVGSQYGATFYMSGASQFAINAQGEIEIMPRDQDPSAETYYVAIHAICDPNVYGDWCHESPPTIPPSNRFAPSTSSNPAVVWIKAGSNSEIVTNGMIYAPLGELEFANVSNDAIVKIRGGMIVARATIHASASAENFEIGVGSQDTDLELTLVATGEDTTLKTTQIVSKVELHYDEEELEDRIDVLTWRVCEGSTC